MTGAEPRGTVVVVDARSNVRLGGMTLLERLLFEISIAVERGLLAATVTLWHRDDASAAPQRRPANLRIAPEAGAMPAFERGTLVIGAWVVPTRGALAGWLGSGAGAGTVDGLPVTMVGDAPVAAADLGGASGDPVVTGKWGSFVRVDDARRLRTAARVLYRSLARPSDGLCAARINRPISRLVTRALVALGVRPNQWSLMLLLLPLVGAALMARGDATGLLVGVWLFNAFSVLDGCDGEIARLTYRCSPQGARLDTTSDMAVHVLFGLALGVGLSRQPGLSVAWSRAYLVEGIVTAVATAAVTAWITRNYRRDAHLNDFGPAVAGAVPVRGPLARLADLIARVLKQDTYNWIFVAMATLGHFGLVLHGLAFGVAVHVIAAVAMTLRGRSRVALRAETRGQP